MRKDLAYRMNLIAHDVKLRDVPSLDEAIKTGQTYYKGKPCRHGHIGVRYTSGGKCIDCAAAASVKIRLKKLPENTSKAIAIDRILDAKEKDYWDDM